LYTDFLPVPIYAVLVVALVALPLIIQYIVSPRHNKGGEKLTSYECGEVPEGSAWVKFNVRFYVIALIFIIFDVEVIFLFPWAVVFQSLIDSNLGFLAFIEMFVFVLILVIGFAYVWVKGDLDWVKMKVKYGEGRYKNLNIKEN
jgi:NADH-quinone oxidoreductase subunit A|tara:strand:+ start:1013 stop:1444 length:432 start_codon:yes stop_codon:yes gene_type:complete